MKVLEVTKSTYFPAFNRLCKEVAQARMEANDNIVYLEPMVSPAILSPDVRPSTRKAMTGSMT